MNKLLEDIDPSHEKDLVDYLATQMIFGYAMRRSKNIFNSLESEMSFRNHLYNTDPWYSGHINALKVLSANLNKKTNEKRK